MKNFILALCLFSINALASTPFQYPENRTYTASDRGMGKYKASSLYGTSRFTLTYDDGPHPVYTAQVLDVLKKHHVKATFFVLTSLINNENSHLIKRMLDEGHLVGSHGVDHARSTDMSKEQWKGRVKKSFQDLAHWYKVSGYELNKFYYRFPYGAYGFQQNYHHINVLRELSQELLGENCIHMAFWDVDTADWVPGMTGEEVAMNMVAHNEGGTAIDFKKVGNAYVKVPYELKNPPVGGVILQHDVHAPSTKGTDLFLTYAKEHGVEILRLDEVDEFKITRDCKLPGLL
jgi:peptidoglycan/xylan/chitin deacetylase (PgdA/CDA1 family)